MSISLSLSSTSAVATVLRSAGCVFAEDEAAMLVSAARNSVELATMVGRRCAGYPLEHIVGWADFYGQRITVAPGVFVPRMRTEFLVERALAYLEPIRRSVVVDLCCGSGNVGAVLHGRIDDVELHASDVDAAAVACARSNLTGTPARVHHGDLFDALPDALRGRVDLIVADAPYVPSAEIEFLPTEARVHEASIALDGGLDGLDFHRRLAADARRWLKPGGALLVETSSHQSAGTASIFDASALVTDVAYCGKRDATVVLGQLG